MDYQRDSVLDMFGLSLDQTILLFSSQRMLIDFDIENTKDKTVQEKNNWRHLWESSILSHLNSLRPEKPVYFLEANKLEEAFASAIADTENLTWYYIIVLELITFSAYTPLDNTDNKSFKRCKYDDKLCYNYLRTFIIKHRIITGPEIDSLRKTYVSSYNKSAKKGEGILRAALITVAVAGAVSTLAAVFAAPIAISLVGPMFPALHGAALINACLAMLGGGALAVGGGGITGGVAVIAGGGALLGLASGGTAAIGASTFYRSPDFTHSQAAKLETVLKEVVINAQHDIYTAQKIMEDYRNQIGELSKTITMLELENQQNKNDIAALKKTFELLKRSYANMNADIQDITSTELRKNGESNSIRRRINRG